MTPPDEIREMTSDGDGAEATLTDEQIETRRTGAAAPVTLDDTGDDSGDTGDDSGDTGDDSADTADATDTADDSGDSGDDSAA